MINNIFQIPVYQIKIKMDNQSLTKFCMSEYYKNEGASKSNVGGWHSNDFTEKASKLKLERAFKKAGKKMQEYQRKINANT